MDQTSFTMRVRIKDWVYGGGAFIISLKLLFFEVLFGFMGLGVVIIVLFLLLLIKYWNKIGLLCSWCSIQIHVLMICGKEVLWRSWNCGHNGCSFVNYLLTVSKSFEDREVVRYVCRLFYGNRGWWINGLILSRWLCLFIMLNRQGLVNMVFFWWELESIRSLRVQDVIRSAEKALRPRRCGAICGLLDHMVVEIKGQVHLETNHNVFDYACIMQVIISLVYVIWSMRNTWKFGSGVVSNFIRLKAIWNVRMRGFLIPLQEITKCKILIRLCSIYKLAGTIMDVSSLSLRINLLSILFERLYGCSVECRYQNKGSKWLVWESVVMGAWYCYIGIIKWMGIFKPKFWARESNTRCYYIYENIKLEL